MAMLARILIGGLIGLVGGGALGYYGKCSSGTCPLTANPYRGALIGAILGALLGWAFAATGKSADQTSSITTVTTEEFDRQVLEANKPVLVDFFATWCLPCKKLAPTMEKLAQEYHGRINVVKVDGDQSPQLIQRYRIFGYPMALLFSHGVETARWDGARRAGEYRRALDAAVGE